MATFLRRKMALIQLGYQHTESQLLCTPSGCRKGLNLPYTTALRTRVLKRAWKMKITHTVQRDLGPKICQTGNCSSHQTQNLGHDANGRPHPKRCKSRSSQIDRKPPELQISTEKEKSRMAKLCLSLRQLVSPLRHMSCRKR